MRLRIIGNDKGSIILTSLIFCAIITALVGAMTVHFHSQTKQQMRRRALVDTSRMMVLLRMILSDPQNCSQNLTDAKWGTEIHQIVARSKEANFQIAYPTGGTVQGALLKEGLRSKAAVIQDVEFINLVAIESVAGGYRADMVIRNADTYGTSFKEKSIPFYFGTDETGKVVSCKATAYPFADNTDTVVSKRTLEDILCSEHYTGDFVYLPSYKTCVARPTTAPAAPQMSAPASVNGAGSR